MIEKNQIYLLTLPTHHTALPDSWKASPRMTLPPQRFSALLYNHRWCSATVSTTVGLYDSCYKMPRTWGSGRCNSITPSHSILSQWIIYGYGVIFGNSGTCIYCVLYYLYCVFGIVSFVYTLSYLFFLYCERLTTQLQLVIIIISRSQWPRGLRRRSTAGHLLRSWVRGLCDELITRPEDSYRLWCVVVCYQETSWNEEAIARAGLQSQKKNYYYYYYYYYIILR
jgi:hypothetical protein